ncbi:MAG: hypothetical protein ABIA93_03545 [Candidatus Woesearchaeota archaeon]
MKKASKTILWFTSLLLLALSVRVIAFPVGEGATGLVTFDGAAPGGIILFLVGLAVSGILVFFLIQKSDAEPVLPEELREDWDELSELEQEIHRIK